jgi:SAM-dependent methyltransferase
MADPYDQLIRYYDAENAGFVEDFAAYSLLADRFGGPVLDVGCGTGRVAFQLVRQGVRVTGIDLSAKMLERARQRAQKQGIGSKQLALHEGDIRQTALDGPFNLAILAYNTFMHFLDHASQIEVLERLASLVLPGGGLALDLPNPIETFGAPDVPGLVHERTFVDPDTGQPVLQQSLASLDRVTQMMSLTWIYDRMAPEGEISRLMVPLQIRYTFASEIELLLERTGWSGVECYGTYNFEPYEEPSPRLFVVATRDTGTQ